ncbi:hypothetical protein PENTCL1PPCAC_22584, partial [Pristionchus entomophagus]
MNVTTLKLLLLLVMIAGVIIAGLLPVRVLKKLRQNAARASTSQKHKNISLILCLLTCFSGGVFLGTCFLHLFPELSDRVNNLITTYDWHVEYPLAELLSCIGFFLLFFLEELVIMLLPSMAHGHSHGHSHGHHAHGSVNIHDEHGSMEKKMESGGCCMTNLPPVKGMEEKGAGGSLIVDGAEESMLARPSPPSDDADGHCQKHCPLTVHDRRNSSGGQGECTNDNADSHPSTPLTPLSPLLPRLTSYGSMDMVDLRRQSDKGLITTVILAEPERCETNCDKDEDPPILMKSSPHAHSHGVRSITLVLALSFHELVEGVAFGVEMDVSRVTALFLSLLIHKVIVAFSTGLQLARTHAHQLRLVVISIVVLSLTSPVGAAFGMMISGGEGSFSKDILITVFQGLAVGTFLYVTFFEILLHERDNEHNNMLKLVVMLAGFSLIGLFRLIEIPHDHSDHAHGSVWGGGREIGLRE